MTQQTIQQIQQLLQLLGNSPGEIDGIWGAASQAALDATLAEYSTGDNSSLVDVPDKNDGDFWSEIKHFKKDEFRCKCGGRYCNGWPAEPQEGMVRIADKIREHFGKPAVVISGLRCPKWNTLQNGVWNSQHQYGEACDITVYGVTAPDLLAYVQTIPGVRYAYHISGSNNVHFDIPAGDR